MKYVLPRYCLRPYCWLCAAFILLAGSPRYSSAQSLASARSLAVSTPAPSQVGNDQDQNPKISLQEVLRSLEARYQVSIVGASYLLKDKLVKKELLNQADGVGKTDVGAYLRDLLEPLALGFTRYGDSFVIHARPLPLRPLERKRVVSNQDSPSSSIQPIYTPAISVRRLIATLEKTISGKVTDQSTNEPLPGVNILAKGTSTGTVTDVEGDYRLTVADEVTTLVFSSIGYETTEEVINGRSAINVNLTPDIQALSEVVVVGYGTVKEKDLTGSVASIKSDALEAQGPKINVMETLQGLAPGLNLTINDNSAAQESVGIQIRGQNSITASNQPLIVLDGVPYAGGLNELNQNDIASIDVLKDASSTAIYGARGANGVIIITTKKGKIGRPTLSYNGSFGLREIYNLPPLMNGQQHWDFAVERYGEDVVASYPTRLENYQKGVSTDWVGLATRRAQQTKHNLSLQGGSESVSYLFSGTYSDVEGVAVGDDFDQLTVRSNLTFDVTDWLTIGSNSQYSYQDLSGLEANFTQAFYLIPLIEPYEVDGSFSVLPWPEEPVIRNPLSNLNVQDEHFKRNLFSNNYLEVNFPFAPGLSYKLNTGLTLTDLQIGRFWGGNTVAGLENNGEAFTRNQTIKDRLIENILVYDRNWGKHALNITALYSTQVYQNDDRSLTTRDFPTPVLTWYQPSVAAVQEPSASYREQRYISQMGRVNYNYNSRYLLTLTLRRDGYSGFGSDDKFGVFPSIAAGWNLGDEAFMANLGWIDQLKLRASYGESGNQAISPYQTLPRLGQVNYLTGDNGSETAPGYFPNSLASPSLGWETSRSLNLGVDAGFFNGKLRTSVDVYRTNTFDLLLDRSISPVHGITNITQNIGETNNRGVELGITSRNIVRKDFSWTTTFNFSYNQNKIVDLYGNQEDDVANGWFIGKPIDANFDYVFAGVWQQNDAIEDSPQPEPGDVRVKDTNKDDTINPDDRDFLGQESPRFIMGLSNNLEYRNLRLSFVLYSAQGMTRANPLWDTDMVWSDVRRNSIMLPYWRQGNPTNAYPANRDGANPYQVRFYQDASFVRLRDITLSYSLNDFMNKLGVNQFRVSFNVRNALTWSPWKGLDPELDEQRGIPIDRTYSLGLNFSF